MRNCKSECHIIHDLDGYWTIVHLNSNEFLVSRFLSSGFSFSLTFTTFEAAEQHILNNIYDNIFAYVG